MMEQVRDCRQLPTAAVCLGNCWDHTCAGPLHAVSRSLAPTPRWLPCRRAARWEKNSFG